QSPRRLGECALPGEHVAVNGIDQRAVQVEEQRVHGASLPRFTDVVPQSDDRFVTSVVLEAEHAHAGGAAVEQPSESWRQAVPACRNHPNDVAAGERQYVAIDAVYPLDEAVGPHGNGFGRFAAGGAIAVEFPAGPLPQDVVGQLPLVAAVVPLDEVGIYLGAGPEAGQFARLRGTLQGAGENADKREPAQSLAQLTR